MSKRAFNLTFFINNVVHHLGTTCPLPYNLQTLIDLLTVGLVVMVSISLSSSVALTPSVALGPCTIVLAELLSRELRGLLLLHIVLLCVVLLGRVLLSGSICELLTRCSCPCYQRIAWIHPVGEYC